ncbi:MAG: N-6 DNA methylase [Candidatus Aenigmatarchaeota archaeon]|jgi:tRNA1(Val) A37 N6-methylase TrmN6
MFKITERSIYEPISEFLKKELNIESISEVTLKKGFIDIFFQINSSSFIVEIKLGKEEKTLTKAIAQAYNYANQRGTKNIVALIFPKIKSGQTVLNIEDFKKAVLMEPVNGYIHTDYWEQWIENEKLKNVLEELYKRFIEKNRKVDFNSVVKAIRELVQELYEVIRQANSDEIFEEVAKKLELFVGLGELDKQKAKTQVSMLASYLLFNQILFYQLYKIKTNDKKLKELKPIKSLNNLKEYFSKIKNIDYQPIYAINLVDKIPERSEILNIINDVIKNLTFIRTEYITQDLAGRFFHALLPNDVAKVWAAFYTNPIAAEILARLAIDKWDERILDPACGSGTLLSACYRRKLELYEEEHNEETQSDDNIKKLHKKFLEEDITGIDIMPFAAHLTAINLATQKLEEPTNIVRVATMDSLDLESRILTPEFKSGEGIPIRPFTGIVQLTLTPEMELAKKPVRRREMPVSPSGMGKEFYLKPVDVVLMNPPFSDREKLPKDYRRKLKEKKELGKICGHQINLWGYFLALADLILKSNGKLAVVIPINIARGKATEKIRNYLLENYHIKYILKTTKDLAFSESAAFKDILLIAEKRKPTNDDLTEIVFLKKSIKELTLEEVNDIINNLKSNIEKKDLFETYSVKQSLFKESFMKFISTSSLKINFILNEFYKKLSSSPNLRKIGEKDIKEGFGFRPNGLSKIIVISNPTSPERLERSELILKKEERDYLIVTSKSLRIDINISKNKVIPALRSLTGMKQMDITNYTDYIILSSYKEFNDIRKIFMKTKINWMKIKRYAKRLKTCNVILPDKINLSSPNTFLISVFSEKSILPSNMFYLLYTENLESSKIFCLFLNSIATISQFILNKPETLGTYSRMRIEDWKQVFILNLESLNKEYKEMLLKLFEKLKKVEFPSIKDQLKNKFPARIELDNTILKILGFSDKDLEEWLPKVYDAIVDELDAMGEVK